MSACSFIVFVCLSIVNPVRHRYDLQILLYDSTRREWVSKFLYIAHARTSTVTQSKQVATTELHPIGPSSASSDCMNSSRIKGSPSRGCPWIELREILVVKLQSSDKDSMRFSRCFLATVVGFGLDHLLAFNQ
ncbi:hypothetical protein EDB19DRAFT_1375385 [Suillus lakei]|nr:hypothetical protein EDB19DRAFT_1375385 [Suillus lakei]